MDKRQPCRSREVKSSKLKQFSAIVLAFVIGYLLSTVYDVAKLKNFLEVSLFEKVFKQATPLKVVKTPESLLKPKFEFYTILTKGEDEITSYSMPTNISTKILTSKIPTFKTLLNNNKKHDSLEAHYLLQVAAFTRLEDARKVQADLFAKNFQANIVEASINNITWYRVSLGPFKTKEDVEAAKQAIARYGNNTIVRKITL